MLEHSLRAVWGWGGGSQTIWVDIAAKAEAVEVERGGDTFEGT